MGDSLKIMIVDDTITYRTILRGVVEDIANTEVVATANNGKDALAKLLEIPTDLLLLDVEMPEMDGLETLNVVHRDYPEMGVVMVSSTSRHSADTTIKALQMGALDFIAKPEADSVKLSREELLQKLQPVIKHVQAQHSRKHIQPKPTLSQQVTSIPAAVEPLSNRLGIKTKFDVVVIGISTGGPNALKELLPSLPAGLGLPIFIVQHMPPVFTESLAKSLDVKCNLHVKEATQAETVNLDTVYIAPGGKHMTLLRQGNQVKIVLNENPPENSCRPAVDVLFKSVASAYGGSVLSVVMTGMGSDGALGVKALKQAGGYSLIQNEETCVVYGMPKAVEEMKLADEIIPLPNLAERIVKLVKGRTV